MEPISVILAVLLLGSCQGSPQISGDTPYAAAADPTSLISPWSQWMSLKAPMIPAGLPMAGGKAKKKLIPGPPPPEGTPEAPWVAWTRTKISSALAPPPALLSAVPPPLAPQPSLAGAPDTPMDPAYLAAQKSLFLSKLFSTLAKVAFNDTNNQDETESSQEQTPQQQLNTALLSGMTRSVRHHNRRPSKKQKQQPVQQVVQTPQESPEVEEDYDQEYEEEEEEEVPQPQAQVYSQVAPSQDLNQNEKVLVSNENSEPNLPKEPENPLHKLFKFGVQKSILSDLTTQPPAQITYIYMTPAPYNLDKAATTPQIKKKSKGQKKKRPLAAHRNSQKHHHSNAYSKNFHVTPSPTTSLPQVPITTESPVDFELLAKALLLGDTTGNGPYAGGRK